MEGWGGETGTARSRSCKGKAVGMSRRTGTGAVNRYRTYGTAATGSVLERKTAKYRFRDQRCSAVEYNNYSRSRALLLKDNNTVRLSTRDCDDSCEV